MKSLNALPRTYKKWVWSVQLSFRLLQSYSLWCCMGLKEHTELFSLTWVRLVRTGPGSGVSQLHGPRCLGGGSRGRQPGRTALGTLIPGHLGTLACVPWRTIIHRESVFARPHAESPCKARDLSRPLYGEAGRRSRVYTARAFKMRAQ